MRILMSAATWDAASIDVGLRNLGALVTTAHDGIEVFESLDLMDHAVVLLETDLPDIRWRVALSQLRAEHPGLSIIVVNSRKDPSDRVAALEIGADDVVEPNTHVGEILARIQSVAARRAGFSGPVLRMGPLRIDLRNKSVAWGPARVHLTPSQYEIVELLALSPQSLVTKERVMGQLYGIEDAPDVRVLDVFLNRIRSSLCNAGAPSNLVETMRGAGFRLNPSIVRAPEDCLPFIDDALPFDISSAA